MKTSSQIKGNKYLLIPGYGGGIRNPFIKQEEVEFITGGFTGFKAFIQNRQAKVFNYSEDVYPTKLEYLNPFFHYARLKRDKSIYDSQDTINALIQTIKKDRPKYIIAHSLGGHLLFNSIKQDKDIRSIPQKVILLSTYLKRNYDFEGLNLPFEIENYYCYWDQALLSLAIYTFYKPAGVFGFKSKEVKNIFYPLKDNINLHTSMVVSEIFAKKLLSNMVEY